MTALTRLQTVALFAVALSPQEVAAQGFIGACVLGLVLAYGIMHNRKRTRAEKQLTEQATKENYRREARKC